MDKVGNTIRKNNKKKTSEYKKLKPKKKIRNACQRDHDFVILNKKLILSLSLFFI